MWTLAYGSGKIKQVVIGERPANEDQESSIQVASGRGQICRERDQCGRVHPGLISLSWRTIRSLKVHIAFFRRGGGRRFFLSHLFSYSFASARRGASRRQREVIIIHSSRHCFKIQSTWHHCYARVVCLSLDPHSIGAVSERARGSTYYCVPWVFKNNDLDFKSRIRRRRPPRRDSHGWERERKYSTSRRTCLCVSRQKCQPSSYKYHLRCEYFMVYSWSRLCADSCRLLWAKQPKNLHPGETAWVDDRQGLPSPR